MEFYIGCFLSIVVLGWWFLCKDSNLVEKKAGIPRGNSGWPFIGETLDFIAAGYTSRPVSFMEKRKSKYGKVFKTNILGTPVIVSTDPEVNKVVLQNQGNIFLPAYPKSIKELVGKSSILQINGSLHRRVHALLAGFLRSPQLKARITKDIETSVKGCLASWSTVYPNTINLQDEVKKITFPILVKVLLSVDAGEDLKVLQREFNEFIKGLICIPVKLPGTTLYKSLKAKEKMLKIVERIIAQKRKDGMKKTEVEKGPPNDAVDVLLGEEGNPNATQCLPLDFICHNMIEMIIPGEETTPTTITLAVKFLTDCPLALSNLREENMELKKQKAESDDEYAWTDYMSLAFTQNVINETLRLANIINAIWRKTEKDVEIKGHLIPRGWCVLASLTSVHMDEKYYDNPYQFNPWRWEKISVVNNNCFAPFGGGQRLCPGVEISRLEISIFLHHLVTGYSWVAEDDTIVYFPTVKMKRKLPIRVTPHNKLDSE
uniref:22alpha-hydroxysteroid 23-monooxygenase n=1 Tax=Polygala tenuifolia TaxID=355332 RepID=A0A3G5ANH7_9FABA|nr:cytochrome P450 oxidase CYP90C29 [Polygala tenuifolia]